MCSKKLDFHFFFAYSFKEKTGVIIRRLAGATPVSA
jgi:hypothetical protein